MLNGFYNYYAVPTNVRALNAFYYHLLWHWLRCCGDEASGTG